MDASKNEHSRKALLYTIIEFTDGIEMVPTVWLSDDKKSCIWPPTKDQIRINKAIANLEVPRNEDEWPVCEILKIFGTAQSYKTGKEKLKMAEQISDIDSASGTENADSLRKSRHSRVAKAEHSSDEDNSREDYPDAGFLHVGSSFTLSQDTTRSFSAIGQDAKSVKKCLIPRERNLSIKHKGSQKKIVKGENKIGAILKDIPGTVTVSNLNKPRVIDESQSIASLHGHPMESIATETVTLGQLHQTLKEVYRKLNSLTMKITNVEADMRAVRDCLSGEQIRSTNGIDLDELGLPFSTSEQLKNFDRQLSDATFRSSMVKALKVIGGGDIQSIVSGILAKILRNAFAEEYSFKGHKGKVAFKDFYNVVTLIIKVVRTHKPQATDKEITESNSTWLSQAKTRRMREEAKQARCRAEEQKEASRRIREDSESEM